jgi:lipid-A-disaccharide synthase
MYAARLARALKQRADVALFGMGGPRMREAGVDLVADYSEVSVVGITEIVRHLPSLVRTLRLLVAEADRRKPALAILTDFPGFHLRLARKLKHRGIPNVCYICPQFWAWRPWRARLVRRRFAKALCIFPFEQNFYGHAGAPVNFIGHPLVGAVHPSLNRREFCERQQLDPAKQVVTVLPGSRTAELKHHWPVLREACVDIHRKSGTQLVVALAPGCDVALVPTDRAAHFPLRVVVGQSYEALSAADAAIVSSGTATIEAALLDVPMVVVYRVTALTALLVKPLLRTSFFSMVNLIADRPVVTELIQKDFTCERVSSETLRLLLDERARETQRAGLKEVRQRLGPPGAVERAADAILHLMASGNSK